MSDMPQTTRMPDLPMAACLDFVDPEAFFDDDGRTPLDVRTLRVVGPERLPCLTWALENGPDGVWGGLTAKERHGLIRTAA